VETPAQCQESGELAFRNFQRGLATILKVSKEELEARIAKDNRERTADRIQRGYKKRGPKSKN